MIRLDFVSVMVTDYSFECFARQRSCSEQYRLLVNTSVSMLLHSHPIDVSQSSSFFPITESAKISMSLGTLDELGVGGNRLSLPLGPNSHVWSS